MALTLLELTYPLFAFLLICTACFRAIGALSSDPERDPKLRYQIDQIASDAVELGVLFRHSGSSIYSNASLASERKTVRPGFVTNHDHVYDLSCLSFPVARAACRYVLMKRILPLWSPQAENNDDNGSTYVASTNPFDIPNLIFITGSGLQHRLIPTVHKGVSSSRDSNNSIGIHPPRSMFMREYVQHILWNDFDLVSVISNRTLPASSTTTSTTGSGSNAITVKDTVLKEWCTSISSRR
jgi:hypothetical protein